MKNKILSKTRFLFFLILLLPEISQAQSFAYKTMLSGLYDSDFPVLKPDQIQDLGSFQVLELEKNKPVLIYCTVGARSQEIGKKLKAAGFSQVYNLYGGIIHWANEGRPVYHQGKITNRIHTYSQPWGIWLKKGEKVY
ncbi:MAG: thiosulfate sulfurtransferase [Algoriphagus sp. 32-45-6]|nr:MAG: thiosulfate sulfurtransferase [Algoriphagus sp. 32-45-6]